MVTKKLKMLSLITALLFLSITIFESNAFARMGGGRSFGSRGSRSYSAPRQYKNPEPSRQQSAQPPGQTMPAAPAGGGFMRGLGGGLLGGLLGGMLFSSLGFAGMGSGFGGSGFGIIEILLLLGLGYFIFKMIKGRKAANNLAYQQPGARTETFTSYGNGSSTQEDDVSAGLRHIREIDPHFDEGRFKDTAMDIFFKVQGAWTNRNLSSVQKLLTDDIRGILQSDTDSLLKDKRTNRLENIAVRKVEIAEVWQESGQDFLTVLFTANLLDYTTDDATGNVVEGSKTEPVRFEEFWTFTRPVGNNPWKLSAINQQA